MTIFVVLIILVCILLVLIVLVQNSKGGGLTSNFSSSNQVMGVRKTTDFLEKATWTLAIALVVLSLVSTMTMSRSAGIENKGSRIEDQINAEASRNAMPVMPTMEQGQGGAEGQGSGSQPAQ